MTRQRLRSWGLVAVALLTCAAALPAAQGRRAGRPGRWELLGTRTVTDHLDHDTIGVTHAKGTFRSLRIEVARRAVDFHRVVVHFASGGDQEVQLRETIKAGGASREIDLEGRDRAIRSIDLWYDAKSLGKGGQAVVRVLGRN
jgi:hypothetical protein